MAMPRLYPHERLLVACARSPVDSASRAAVSEALAAPGLDWTAAVVASVRHGLAQHVALHLRDREHDPRIPAPVAAAFARMYRANARRNMLLFAETARLLRAFDAAGVRCRVLKGVPLSLTVYPEHALRNFADMDVLVEADWLEDAHAEALRCGFRYHSLAEEEEASCYHRAYYRACSEDILTDTVAPEFDPALTERVLAPHRRRFRLEIHRGLFHDLGRLRPADLGPFWEGPQIVALPDGTPMAAPSPEAMVVHLTAHAAAHGYDRLLYPLDLAQVIRHYGTALAWERVEDLAGRYGVRPALHTLLDLAAREFGVSAPLTRADGGTPLELPDIFEVGQRDHREAFLRAWLRAAGRRERVRALIQTVAPRPDAMRRIYGVRRGVPVVPLYLYRPFQLTVRLLRVLFALTKRKAARKVARS